MIVLNRFYCTCVHGHFFNYLWRPSITFANRLDPDQAQQNIWSDLIPNCLTLWWCKSKEEGKDQESIQSSTTPDLGRHMEKCQNTRKHRNKILTTPNHDFRSGLSCKTQRITTVHDLLWEVWYRGPVRHGHISLLKSLQHCNPPEIASQDKTVWNGRQHRRLVVWLPNRKLWEVIDGEKSKAVPVDSGVPPPPENKCLGPFYFFAK